MPQNDMGTAEMTYKETNHITFDKQCVIFFVYHKLHTNITTTL